LIKWYHWILFAVVVLVALAMSWYSMMDLSTNTFSIPWLLSAGVSLAFDGGAIWLGMMSIEYAKTQDSGAWAEIWTFAFVLTSVYINVQHAVIGGFGLVGMIMFGAAPVIAGVMLKVLLSFITRQQRRTSGRLVDRLPTVGWLTWLRYRRQTWKLMSVAMQKRLVDAADKLDISSDKHAIFVAQVEVPEVKPVVIEKDTVTELGPAIKTPQISSETVETKQLTTGDNVSLPVWLPYEPTMTLATLVRTCMDNGVLDMETIYRHAKTLKGQDVNKLSLYKTLDREKKKVA
jgi:hypothetical protein